MCSLEDLTFDSKVNRLVIQFLVQYEKTFEQISEAEQETFLTRLKTMAYRQIMYSQKLTPVDIILHLPCRKSFRKRYKPTKLKVQNT